MKPFVYFWTTFSFRQRGFWHVFLFSIMFILNKVINVMIFSWAEWEEQRRNIEDGFNSYVFIRV